MTKYLQVVEGVAGNEPISKERATELIAAPETSLWVQSAEFTAYKIGKDNWLLVLDKEDVEDVPT